MAIIFYEEDADITLLKDKKIAIIGYGAQGHAQAQNLRDSGCDVIIAELEGTSNYEMAKRDGFTPVSAQEASAQADYIQMLVPDQTQKSIYESAVKPNLKPGKVLGFSHGFNIHFGQIVPPPDIDVVMIAPKGPGKLVRRVYTEGGGVPCVVAVHQDASGKALDLALSYGKAIGGTKAGIIETTFEEETETDLFGEQVVLCGGLTELIRAGFDTLVEAGYQPEIAYFECCHELKLIIDLIHEKGITGMRQAISGTARYGDVTRGKWIINDETRETMQEILSDIQTGEFAKEWILENQANQPVLNALVRNDADHLIEEVGEELRSMMGWLKEEKR